MKTNGNDRGIATRIDDRTMAMAMSVWNLERTRRDRPDSPRARIILLRTHQRLQSVLEERQEIPPEQRTRIRIQDAASAACLLIHGSTGSPADMEGLAGHLHRSGLTVYSILLPGHGRPDTVPPEVLWRACLREVVLRFRLLRRFTRRVYVVGHGFGGALAIHLAEQERVAGLALLAPALIPRVSLVERLLFRLGIHRLPWIQPRLGWTEEILAAMKRARALTPRLRVPVYAAQCDDDDRISPVSLRVLQKGARHVSSRFRVFGEGGHQILATHGETSLFREIQEFFRAIR